MSKLELPAGQDNIIMRNQEGYGFLPKDVIDRLGDTSAQLETEDQTALGAINEIKSNLSLYDNLGYPFDGATTATVYNCTGTIVNDLKYVISGNMMAIGGRVRINSISRSGGNCGVKITLPNNRLLAETYNAGYPISLSSYSDGIRNGESTMLSFTQNQDKNYFIINVTESYSNVANGKNLVLIVPLCFIRLAPT